MKNAPADLALGAHMRVPAKPKCTHFPKTRQCPAGPLLEQYDASHGKFAHLQRHQEALTLYVGKAEVDTSGKPVGIAIPNDMLHPLIDSVDEPSRKLFDPGMISLRRVSKTRGMHNKKTKQMSLSTPARNSQRGRLRGPGNPSGLCMPPALQQGWCADSHHREPGQCTHLHLLLSYPRSFTHTHCKCSR
jgi:hypothetical protein